MSSSETNVETKVDVMPKATSLTSDDGLICEYDPSLLEFPESPTKESVRWTPEEDEMLRAAVALYKGKNWKKRRKNIGREALKNIGREDVKNIGRHGLKKILEGKM